MLSESPMEQIAPPYEEEEHPWNEQLDRVREDKLVEYTAPPRELTDVQLMNDALVMVVVLEDFGSVTRNIAPPVDREVQLRKEESLMSAV